MLGKVNVGGNKGGGYSLEDSGTIKAEATHDALGTVRLYITDPTDLEELDTVWKETIVVKKVGSVPSSIEDGIVVAKYEEKNKYSTEPLIDTNEDDIRKDIYYRAFPRTKNRVVNRLLSPSDSQMVDESIWFLNPYTKHLNQMILDKQSKTQNTHSGIVIGNEEEFMSSNAKTYANFGSTYAASSYNSWSGGQGIAYYNDCTSSNLTIKSYDNVDFIFNTYAYKSGNVAYDQTMYFKASLNEIRSKIGKDFKMYIKCGIYRLNASYINVRIWDNSISSMIAYHTHTFSSTEKTQGSGKFNSFLELALPYDTVVQSLDNYDEVYFSVEFYYQLGSTNDACNRFYITSMRIGA